MTDSFKAFMQGIIDYAGLFPPAELPLDKAIRNFRQYLEGDDSWMLSRFIIPASILDRLDPYVEELFESENLTLPLSVLGSTTNTISEFIQEIESVTQSCEQLQNRHTTKVTTDLIEIKLPREAALSGDQELILEMLMEQSELLSKGACQPKYVYFESYFEESWKMDLKSVLKGLSIYNEKHGDKSENIFTAGFKLRCGGVEAHQFPAPEQVAFAINRARDYRVSLKCTAGLHHPVRHYNDSVQTKMHGFFNVFGAALLAYANNLNDDELAEIIKEEDPEHFEFSDEVFKWLDFHITTPDINKLRNRLISSFGSCSFDEPIDDLKKLRLL